MNKGGDLSNVVFIYALPLEIWPVTAVGCDLVADVLLFTLGPELLVPYGVSQRCRPSHWEHCPTVTAVEGVGHVYQ